MAFLQEPRLVEAEKNGIRVGSHEWFELQRDLIKSRPLMRYCYDIWYDKLLEDAGIREGQAPKGLLVELGSGGSYLKERCPALITSDVEEGIAERVIDAQKLPFEDGTVQALFLTHVFHHIPNVSNFLKEAQRVLMPGGVVAMIEVAHTPFARFFFSRFHPEPYESKMTGWAFDQQDAMMDSNQALSWMVFERDRGAFEEQFPEFEVQCFERLTWLAYLASGGVTRMNLVPRWLNRCVQILDKGLAFLNPVMALHWHISLCRGRGTVFDSGSLVLTAYMANYRLMNDVAAKIVELSCREK